MHYKLDCLEAKTTLMSRKNNSRLTAKERTTYLLLQFAPWLAFLVIALPFPIYFLLRYFNAASGSEAGELMLLAMTSLAAGSIIGLFVVVLMSIYRWQGREVAYRLPPTAGRARN